jgi:DNA-binding GntR family transcriptional regulator
MERLRPVRRTLLRDTAYQAIRDAIVRGELPPGATLSNAELAERLGLSRAPIRDALARLADEGLVETKPQSFTRVTPLAPRDAQDAAAVVRAMHELAARTATPDLTDADIAAMRAANERFVAATRSGDIDAAMRADDDFHGVLVRVCGNRAVAATIDRYTPLIRRLERLQFRKASAERSAALHEELIRACEARDPAKAVEVTTRTWHQLEDLAEGTSSAAACIEARTTPPTEAQSKGSAAAQTKTIAETHRDTGQGVRRSTGRNHHHQDTDRDHRRETDRERIQDTGHDDHQGTDRDTGRHGPPVMPLGP